MSKILKTTKAISTILFDEKIIKAVQKFNFTII